MAYKSKKTLSGQTRAIIFNVLQFMQKEAEEGHKIDLKAVQTRAARATGISVSTMRRISREARAAAAAEDTQGFRTPGKKRNVMKRVTKIDAITQGVIKRIIHNFHKSEGELPSIDPLLLKLQKQINFKGSSTSLRRVVKGLGFEWKRKDNDRKRVWIENTKTRLKRIEYLQALSGYRLEGRPVVFADESYIIQENNFSEGPSNKKKLKHRVDILLAASEVEILPSTLKMFKADVKSVDNNEYLTYKKYEAWVKCSLIPNLPPNSVVVVVNSSIHNKLENEPPTSNARRADMEAWLHRKNIVFSEKMLKPQLYKLISENKDNFKAYSLDRILNENNHSVLRIPPLNLDLNPMEEAWKIIKDDLDGKYSTKVMTLVKEKISTITSSEWKDNCCKVKYIEEEYQMNDQAIDKLTDKITLKPAGLGFDSEMSSDNDDVDDDDEERSESEADDSIDQYLQFPLSQSRSPLDSISQDSQGESASSSYEPPTEDYSQAQNKTQGTHRLLEALLTSNSAKKPKLNESSLVVITRVNRPKPTEIGKITNTKFNDPVIITKLVRAKVNKTTVDVPNIVGFQETEDHISGQQLPIEYGNVKTEPQPEPCVKEEPIEEVGEMSSNYNIYPIQFEMDIKCEETGQGIKEELEH